MEWFGSAINGFIGLMAAIIGISGIIGGFFLRKLKKEKDESVILLPLVQPIAIRVIPFLQFTR